MLKHMLLTVCVLVAGAVGAMAVQDKPSVSDCLTNTLDSGSIYCRGSRAINNMLNNLNKSDRPIVLLRGLEIVPSKEHEQHSEDNKSRFDELEDNSFIGKLAEYLRTHELNLKFAELLADDESERHLAHDRVSSSLYEARNKKDKGQGYMLVVVAMFAKMMAALGLGGIGMLAMKALAVATAALVLAALVGLKSMEKHGHESSHSVQYIPSEGHHHMRRRRRRSIDKQVHTFPLAYHKWQFGITPKSLNDYAI